MPKASSRNRRISVITSKAIVCQQTSTKTTAVSANLIRARSSTIHASSSATDSTNSLRSSVLLNHNESEMSSSLHIMKTSALLSSTSEETNSKPKMSQWFWRRKNTFRNSIVRSSSTNKANERSEIGAGGWTENRKIERPSADEAYESKSSTLDSTITIDSVPVASRNQSITRSVSTKEAKPTRKILRFLRVNFSPRTKKPTVFRPDTPPLSMTQSGLETLAGRQANIAKIFADPNDRLSK
ncbi:hypothetical protein TSMEX_003646 [Taenia solium]